MAGDAIWIEVLPAFDKFGGLLTKGTTGAATSAGKSAGQSWSKAFGSSADAGAVDAQVAQLQQAATKSSKAVEAQTQAIAKARAAQRESAAKVAEAEAKLEDVLAKSGEGSKQAEAASLRLEAARERLSGASAKTEATERSLSAASTLAKDDAAALASAQDKLGDSASKSEVKSRGLSGAWDKAKAAFGGAGGGAGGLVGKLGALAAAAGASMAIADQLGAAWGQAMEKSSGVTNITASLGLDEGQAKQAGDAASALFAGGFGASMTDVTGAVESVMSTISGLRDAGSADIEALTGKAMGMAAAFDVEVGQAASNAGVLIKTGLAKDATAAFDLMAAGLQQVPQALRGEVMDATQEYSQFFAQLGMDGPTAMGALVSAAEGGKYQLDKTGDAMKEFTIRSTDMSKTSVAAYGTLGLNAQDMSNKILAGGDSAKGAFDQIVSGLLGIDDPATRANTAIALFGTPLEDIGTDKIPTFLASLQSTGTALGDVSGKAGEVAAAMSSSVDPVESLKRSFQTTLADGLQPFVGPAQQIADWAKEHPGLMQAAAIGVGILAVSLTAAAAAMAVMMVAASPVTLIVGGIVLALGLLAVGIYALAQNWGTIWSGIQAAAQVVGDWFAGPFAAFFVGIWDAITGAFSAAGSAIAGVFQGLWDWVAGVFSALWGGLVAIFAGPIDMVRKIIEVFAAAGLMVLQAAWDGIVAGATWLWDQIVAIWTAISGFLQPYVEALTGFVSEKWTALVNGVTTAVGWLRDQLTAIWTTISDGVRGIVQPLVDWAVGAFSGLRDRAVEIFGDLKTKVTSVFEGLKSGIATVWDGIKAVFSAPVRWVVDIVVNPLIRSFNSLADKVGMKDNKLAEWKFDGFARGGVLSGFTPVSRGDDQIVAMRSGEGVYVSEAMRDPRERARLHAVNSAALAGQSLDRFHGPLQGLATGGVVQPVPGSGKQHTSGYPWASYAGDFAQPMGTPVRSWKDGVVAMVKYLTTSYGQHVRINHPDNTSSLYAHLSKILVAVGQQVSAGQTIGNVGSTGNSSGPHLHFETMGGAYTGGSGGGAGFDILGALTSAFAGPLAKLKELGDTGFGGLVKGIPGMIVEGMKSKLTSLGDFVGSVAAGPLKLMAQQMLAARGWSQHWPALDKLVQGESSWNPLATNPSSGAYGLPQALPGSKMAAAGADWRVNPATQLRWMLDFHIPSMGYGTPTGAYNKWLSRSPHWYDQGGELAPGLSLTYNGTGQVEPILTAHQWQVAERAIGLASAAAGRGGGTTIQHAEFHVTVDADDLEQVRDVVELFGRLGFEAELQGV